MTGEVKTFTGWGDPNYKPAPGATPFPDCWTDEFAIGGSAEPPAASVDPNADGRRRRSAPNIAFDDRPTLTAPADAPFAIHFDNQDAGVQHNVEIKDAAGQRSFKGDVFTGVADTRLRGAGPAGRRLPVRLHGAPEHDGDPDRGVDRPVAGSTGRR